MAGLRSGYVVAGHDGSLEAMANVKAGMREDRLKAALRENLKRRKAQARGREVADRDCGVHQDGVAPEDETPAKPKGRQVGRPE